VHFPKLQKFVVNVSQKFTEPSKKTPCVSSSSSIVSVSCIIIKFFFVISLVFRINSCKKVCYIVSVVSNVDWYCKIVHKA